MLVLSRKVDQTILIGDGIEIMVTKISGERVKVGVTAPEDTKILRGELLQETKDGDRGSR